MPLFSLYPQNKAKNNNNDYVQLEYSSTLLALFLAGMAWAELSSIHLQSVIQLANEERERTNSLSRFVPPRAQYLAILLYYSEHFNINNLPNDNIFAETNK